MAQIHTAFRAIITWQVEDIPLARRGGLFPLTLTLSLGEREQRALRSGEPRSVDCSPGRAGFTLSPRERAGVRGNGAKYVPRIGPIPELWNSASPPAEPEDSQKDHERQVAHHRHAGRSVCRT